MSERQASYTVEPDEEDPEHSTRIRMNFKLLANGTCQPDVTIDTSMPPMPDDDILIRMTVTNAKALTIATYLGRRWEKVFKSASYPDPEPGVTVEMPDVEEIEGWLVKRER